MRKLYVRLSDTLLLFCLFVTATVWGQTPVQQPDGSWEVILTTSGTWTVPDNVYEITVEAVGGGGGGGRTLGSLLSGGGGGGGAYVQSTICTTPSTPMPYSIGSGGQGSNINKNGGDTWFVNASTVLAKGGVGAVVTTGVTLGSGGAGGSADASVGDTKISGVSGAPGEDTVSGKGGNAGYTATVGSIGAGNTGAGGIGVTGNTAGSIGTNYGGGGSGAKKGSSVTSEYNGGVGAPGVIKITYYVYGDITSVVANPTYCAGEDNIMLTATKSEGLENFSTLWFEGGTPEIHFSNQFVTVLDLDNLTDTNIISNTGGVLQVESTSPDPYITFANIPTFDTTTSTHISVRYKYVSGTVNNPPSIKHGTTEVNGTNLINTGDWRITTFDISTLESNITDFELHWASDSGVILDLDYIVVANQPVIEGVDNFSGLKTSDNSITINTENPNTYHALRLIEESTCNTDITHLSINIGTAPETTTFEFGEGVWNIYVWNAADDDVSAQPWEDNYSGFLVSNPNANNYFSSVQYWEMDQSPSYSTNYTGCYVNPNRHSFSLRQTDFDCGLYDLTLNPGNNELELYINNNPIILYHDLDEGLYLWSGLLDPEDEVEIRYNKDIGEQSFLAFVFTQASDSLEGGVIDYLSPTMICSDDQVVFDESNTTPATGGSIDPEDTNSLEYQWEVNYDDTGFVAIDGATEEFYTTTQTALGTYVYRRKVTDFCGEIEYTNEITIIRGVLEALTGGTLNYTSPLLACLAEPISFDDISPVTGGLSNPDVGGAVTYQWQISTDNGATFADIVEATDEFYTTTQTGAGIYVYRREVTDLCDNTAYTNEITVVRTTLDTLDPGEINYTGTTPVCPEQQVIFDDVTPAEVVFTDTEIDGSVSYQWQVNYAGGGFEDIDGATEAFYTTTQTDGGVYIYRRMVTDQCNTEAYTNEITITRYNGTPLNAGSIDYETTTILCSDDVVDFDESNTTPASGGVDDTLASSSLVYQWEVKFNDGDFEDIDDATGEFYTTTETAAGTYIYRRKVTDVACENSVWTNEVTIIRSDSNTLNGGEISYTAPSTLCTPVTAVVFDESNTTPATGGGSSPDVEESLDYQWEVNYNDTGFVAIDEATEEFYTTTQEEEGTYIYRRKVTDFCENVSYTNEVTIIRSELDELLGGIINYLESSLACIEDPVTFDDVTSATGGLTDTDLGGSVIYQWEVSIDGGVTFADIVGATEEFYTTTETGAGTYIYRRKATDFCGNIAYTNQITITRTTFDPLVGGVIEYAGNPLVCPIQAVTFNNFTTPTGGHTDTLLGGSISYQWEVKHDSDEFEEITGATEEHYTTAQLGAGVYVYKRKATDQCGSTDYSNEITITRLGGDILMGGVISYTGPTTLCTPEEEIIFNDVTPATGGVNDAAASTSLVYQWELSHNGGGFVAIDGATGEFYTTTETASGTYIYRRRVTDTYCTNSAWTNEITINRSELSPLDGGTINYLESSVACPNASIEFNDITPVTGGLSDPGIGGSVTYQWEVSTDDGDTFDAIVDATEEFYTTEQLVDEGTYVYRRKVTDACNTTTYTNSITIIRQALDLLNGGTINYTDTTVCFGDIIDFDNVTAASGGLTASEDGGSISYQWEVSMDGGINFSAIVDATSEFYTSNEVGVGTYTYRRRVTDACGSEAWTNNITITRGGKTFTGLDSVWDTATNWTPEGVPTATDCVIIPNNQGVVISSSALSRTVLVQSGGSLTIESSGTLIVTEEIINQANPSDFTVRSGANLIQVDDVANTGEITVERISNPMDTFNFTYWGAPVNTTLNNIAWYSESASGMFTVPENSNISTSFAWNATTGSWDISQMPYMGTMAAGIGYLVKAPDSFITSGGKKPVKATFSGIPNNGDISVNIVAGNHNLLSNPYPSAIDIDKFLTEYAGTTTQGTIYLWSNGEPIMTLDDEEQLTGGFTYGNSDFATYTLIGGTGVGTGAVPSGYVASGQAFFVEGNTGGTVTFKNEYRYDGTTGYNNTLFFKTMNPSAENQGLQFEKHRFWLNLTGENTEFKQTLIGYADLATDGIDFLDGPQYDAGNPTNLYTTIDNTKYAIQAYELPFENTDETPLGYTVGTAGTFTITLHAFDGLFDNQDIYIKDNVLNLVHNLKDGAYEFLTDAGTFENRFSVVYVPQGGLDTNIPAMAQNWIAYLKDGQIQLESLGFDMKEVYVYDMLGREVYAKQNINANQHTLSRVNGNQILIVKVISTDDVSSVKKVQN